MIRSPPLDFAAPAFFFAAIVSSHSNIEIVHVCRAWRPSERRIIGALPLGDNRGTPDFGLPSPILDRSRTASLGQASRGETKASEVHRASIRASFSRAC